MSSAKPTPRYVQRIPSPNIHLVGGNAEAQVIPIRRVTPAYVPTIETPATPAAPPRRTKRFVPVERRPWLVLLVPPTPGARPRSFGVARWQAQVVVGALAISLLLAGGAVVAVVGAVQASDLFGGTETDQLRERLELLEDSLTLARAELATDDEVVGDSLFDVLPSAAIPMPAGAPGDAAASRSGTTRRPALSRPARTSDENGIDLMPRSLENLPVIGRIASGFSRSRRHPVLHIRRPHLGVDVAAPRGTHIIAPAAGKITFVGRKFGFGIVVEMDHGSGIRTRYAHLTAAMVHVGDDVAKGTFIATVGSTGITTGPHLHYEVLVNGRQVDPLRYRLPQPIATDGALSTAPTTPTGPAVVAPVSGGGAAPETGSRETQSSPQASPAPK